jgi:hypothetical protein
MIPPLAHLGEQQPDQAGPYLTRMRSQGIGTVAGAGYGHDRPSCAG